MKNTIFALLLFLAAGLMFSGCSSTEDIIDEGTGADSGNLRSTIISIRPSNNLYEAQMFSLVNQGVGTNGPGKYVLNIAAWTWGGKAGYGRYLLKFDLSRIYPNDNIKSAKLSLYTVPNPGPNLFVPSNQGSNNAFYIRQVTSNWGPYNVSWEVQPSSTTANQVYIPHTNLGALDLIDIDVTGMVKDMVRNNRNYGFLLQLANETRYTCRQFYASFHSDASKHPKLVIEYE